MILNESTALGLNQSPQSYLKVSVGTMFLTLPNILKNKRMFQQFLKILKMVDDYYNNGL